ncbi:MULTISPECIES: LytR/AlgR family response regulator transcription factor [Spirosoma]|uniref:LytTR family DNA-binding domain-containing protein n=1 Tax=Spirosoma liriopis TaxID=2937440 RepID=A0ABT0HTL1_9BACT|nr:MULTISPECIES: LytTR family DNA-binding domain-containing protein [Spirosoma]MCK8495529.1 LytTR family DNA-binding domain-containing protein [Spirosoma liriopis]UHG94548.1 LytTR family DNA-binding domain-containing protein [Spirosoma oryzicola]
MTCIILDDEEICVNQLRKFIEKVPTLHLKACFTNPSDAIVYLEREKVDLVFVDMEMPNLSLDGLDFVRILGDSQNYIFTTAHPKYASPSYEHKAIDFLEKPFSFERFSIAVQRAKQLLEGIKRDDSPAPDNYTFVRVDGNLQRVDFSDLCWVESERNGIWFYTETNRFHSALTISDIGMRLPQHQFFRIHKSYIIPVNKAEVINKYSICILRQGKLQEIPIGDTYRKEFITFIENKVMKK